MEQMGFESIMVRKGTRWINLDRVRNEVTNPCLQVEAHFKRMSQKFDQGGHGRKYFPPLRYVALRLLHYDGYEFNYRIPAVKTDCKVRSVATNLRAGGPAESNF